MRVTHRLAHMEDAAENVGPSPDVLEGDRLGQPVRTGHWIYLAKEPPSYAPRQRHEDSAHASRLSHAVKGLGSPQSYRPLSSRQFSDVDTEYPSASHPVLSRTT